MIVLYILLGVLAALFLCLFLNIHIIFQYNNVPSVSIRVLCFRLNGIKFFQKFFEKKDQPQEKQPKNSKVDSNEENKNKKNIDALGFIKFLAHITRVLRLLLKEQMERMKFNLKELHVSIGTDDAAKTALLCGSAIQGANVLCALLQRFSNFRFDNRNLSISPNFTEEKTKLSIDLDLSTRVFDIIVVILRAYFRFLEREEFNHARNTIETGH